MDVLSGFLDGPRAAGAFLLRSLLEPPWSLRIQDEAPLTIVALVRGEAWIAFDGDEPQRLGSGDVAIVRGPDPYTVAHRPGATPDVVIHPGQVCATPDGHELHDVMALGVRTWGNDPDGSVVMLTGTYTTDGEVSRRLLDALAPLTVLTAAGWHHPAVALLTEEIVRDEPGQEAVLDRLLDLVLVAALRATFSGDEASVPAWYRASGDPVVGPALRLMHEDPAAPWTVATLAAQAGVSRAALARRFHELVGEPPMTFLTGWRMAIAADLLLEPGVTVGQAAARAGYGSPFTFSTAFKRHFGQSPRAYRDARRASTSAAATGGAVTPEAVRG